MKKNLAFYSILFFIFLIIQRGSGVLTKIVLANNISPNEYGLIILVAVTIPSILQIFSNLNFYQILSHSKEGKNYFGFSILVTSLLMIIISIILLLLSESFFLYLNIPTGQTPLLLFIILLTMWTTGLLVDFQGLFTGLRLYSLPGLILVLPSIIRLAVIILLVFSNNISLVLVLLVFGFSSLIPLFYISLVPQYRKVFSHIRIIKIPDKRILAFGTTVFIISSFSIIGQQLVKIVISHELGIEWQGFFDISLTLSAFLVFGLSTIGYVSIPESTANEKLKLYQKGGLIDIARLLFAFCLITTVVLYFYSNFLVLFLFSKDYLPAADYVVILAIGYLFLFLQAFLVNVNLAYAENIREFFYYLIPAALMIPLFFTFTQICINFFKDNNYGNGFLGAYISFTSIIIAITLFTLLIARDRKPIKSLLIKSERLGISLLIPIMIILIISPDPFIGLILLGGIFSFLVFGLDYLDKSIITDIFSKKEKF